jgi:hypothetical protein
MQQLNDVLCRAGIDPGTDVATAFEMQTKGEAFVALDQSDDEWLGDLDPVDLSARSWHEVKENDQ